MIRQYEDNETPTIGDVVQLFEGAYGTAIVTEVHTNDVVCGRVHAFVGPSGIQIGVERITISKYRAHRLAVFVIDESDKIDNRRL